MALTKVPFGGTFSSQAESMVNTGRLPERTDNEKI